MFRNETKKIDEKLISSKRASEISGYSKDYIGQLCRGGKIKCQRIGRDWFVDAEDLISYKNKKSEQFFKKPTEEEKKININKVESKIVEPIIESPQKIFTKSQKSSQPDIWDKELLGFEEKFSFFNLKKFFVPAISVVAVLIVFFSYTYASPIKNFISDTKNEIAYVASSIGSNLIDNLDYVSGFSEKTRNIYVGLINSTGDAIISFANSARKNTYNIFTTIKIPKIDYSEEEISKIEMPDFSSFNLTAASLYSSFNDIFGIFSETVENTAKKLAEGVIMFPQNIKELIAELMSEDEITTIVVNQTSDFVQTSDVKETQTSDVKNSGLIVQAPLTVKNTIIEKTIERIISGITQEQLDEKLQTLDNKLSLDIQNLTNQLNIRTYSSANASVASNFQTIALTNRIDNLSNVVINNSTITGTLGGITDEMIPDSITASNYLPLTGGTLTGALVGTDLTLSGNLGIGTTSPSDVFALNGAAYFASISAPSVTTNRLYNISNDLYWAGNLIGGSAVGTWTSDGTHVWRPSGNVGIGTTSPATKIDVNGSAQIYNISGATTLTVKAGSGQATTDLQQWLDNSGNGLAVLTSSGRLGIGIAAPTSRIHGVTTLSAATGDEIAYRLDYTTNKLTSGNDTGLLINQTDTASPGTSLLIDAQVGGVSKFSVSNEGIISGIADPLTQYALLAGRAGGQTLKGDTASGGNLTLQSTSHATKGKILFGTSAYDEVNNWLGIGIATPETVLDVQGAVGSLRVKSTTSTNYAYQQFSNAGGDFYIGKERSTGGGILSGSAAYASVFSSTSINPIQFGVNNAVAMTILSGGNVGIGTTGPANKLDVNGGAVIGSYAGSGTWSDGLAVSGRVGIGILIPVNALHVEQGSINANSVQSDTVFNGVGSGNTTSNIIGSDGYWAIRTALNNSYNLDVYNSGSPLAAITVLQSGNVGIGTTSPATKIDVNGSAQIYNISGATTLTVKAGSGQATTDLQQWLDNSGNGLAVLTSSGRLGIGTTSPTSRIHGVTTLSAATGNEIAYQLNYTTNKATSGNDTGLLINQTDTASPGTSLLADLQVGGVSKFSVDNAGVISGIADPLSQYALLAGRAGGQTLIGGSAVTDILKLQGTLGDGTLTSPAIQALVGNNGATTAFTVLNNGNVGIGTTSPFAKLSVAGNGYFDGTLTASTFSATTSMSAPYFTATDSSATSTFAGGLSVGSTTPDGSAIFEVGTSSPLFVINKNSGKVGIGTANPSAILDVNGGAKIQTLTVGLGGGAVSNNTAVGVSALAANTTGHSNTATGYWALKSNITGLYNTAFGSGALQNSTAHFNTAFGWNALNLTTTGGGNTAIGVQALYYNTTGDSNFAGGYGALTANTTGSFNTAAGYGALYNDTTGSYNTGLGYYSGVGYYPAGGFTAVIAAGGNVDVGYHSYKISFVLDGVETQTTTALSGPWLTDTNNKTIELSNLPIYSGPRTATRKIYRSKATGWQGPFYLVTTLNDNTTTTYSDTTADASLGAQPPTGASNSIALGYGARYMTGNQFVIGSTGHGLTDSYWGSGIDDTSPVSHIFHGTGASGTDVAGGSLTFAGGQGTGTGLGGSLIFKTSPAGSTGSLFNSLSEAMRITSAGNVGIGTTSPLSKLSVQGTSGLSAFNIASSTGASLLTVDGTGNTIINGNVGIASSSPFAQLAIEVDSLTGYAFVVSDQGVANPYFSISKTGTTTIETLLTGAMSFGENAGAVSWIDMPVTSGAALGTVESYTAQIDSQSLLTLYSQSDGAGGLNGWSVGIGTTSPMGLNTYSFVIATGTAYCTTASCWTDPSSRELKTHIEQLTDADLTNVLAEIASTSVYFFNMKYDPDGRKHLGVIAEEAPDWFTTPDKSGISGSAFANFLMAGMKGLMMEVEMLKNQSANVITATGEGIANLVITAKEFIADKITAKKVVTDALEMKDSVTGEAYCVRITNGEWEKFKGTCGDLVPEQSTVQGSNLAPEQSTVQGSNLAPEQSTVQGSNLAPEQSPEPYPQDSGSGTTTPEIIPPPTESVGATSTTIE